MNISHTIDTIWGARKSLPLPVRMAAGWVKRKISPHWLWESKEFKKYFDFIQQSQWWSLEELKAYQLEQLKSLVKFSYENVPYYQRSFREKRIHPSDIKTLEDIQLLPLITKEEVRSHVDEFIPNGVDVSKLRVWVTGGTSGIPLKVYQDLFDSCLMEEAFRLRQWMWAGYKQYDRKMILLRQAVEEGSDRCWDYYNNENQLVLSSRDMTEKNMHKYLEVVDKFKPLFMEGYPSAMEIFARFIKRNDAAVPSLKAIFSETEALYPGQRDLIEMAFKGKIFSGYGMSEGVADATECEQHCGYHVSMEYGILELIDKNNEPINAPGVPGVVVGTGFKNKVMPLIRYQMFDVAEFSENTCSCGRNMPLIKKFKGRVREYFVGKSGKLIPLQLVWSGRHPVWSKIREMKFVQEQEGKVLAKIVRAPNLSDSELVRELQAEMRKILTQDEFDVQVEFVDELPLTHRGKLNFLDQKIPLGFEDIADMNF